MTPLVSVIIPNYNHEKYLDLRIKSILMQTFQDFEIIILDDKSPDNSKNIIEQYRNHPKVSHIIYNENNSGSTFIQWNKGFELSKGDYIWIAESDDFCDKTLLEKLLKAIIEDKMNVIAFCQSQLVNSKGEYIPPYLNAGINLKLNGKTFIKAFMLTGNRICNASSAIFKKQTLKSVDNSYMGYKAGGDRLFWIEIAQYGNVIFINEPLNYFRQHEQKVSPKRVLDGTVFKEAYRTYKYLKHNGYINWLQDYFIRNQYLYRIIHTKFENNQIKNNLLLLWNNSCTRNIFLTKLINHFYIRLQNLYIKYLLKYKNPLFRDKQY